LLNNNNFVLRTYRDVQATLVRVAQPGGHCDDPQSGGDSSGLELHAEQQETGHGGGTDRHATGYGT